MNIIIIDYAFTSDDKLQRICDELSFNYETLKKDKKELKLYRVWIETISKTMIAYSTTYSSDEIIYTDEFNRLFETIPIYIPRPAELPAPKVNLNIDSILDKISKFGIESLLKEERDFLDKFE